jgi:N-acyl-D-amino-acid deacylase
MRLVGTLPLVLGLAACARPSREAPLDLLITGATIVDGTGVAGATGDVAVRGDRIARVSRRPLARAMARRVIDATGKVVAPGFIDMHAHLEPLLRLPGAENLARQGVTTALGGPDGGGPLPLDAYLDSAAAAGLGINVAFLVGHNTVRRAVMGLANRAPTAAELDRMRERVAGAMGQGAWGLSTGLIYLPGTFANTNEIVALARVAADSGGIYTSHLRDEGMGLVVAVAEALEIGRRARIPVVLTHHKAVGKAMWGASARTLAMVDSARAAGTDVMMDQYPYTATYTGIAVLVPQWALADGDTAFARRLGDAVLRDSIVRGIVFNILNDRGGGDLRRIQLARVEWSPDLEGKTLADWSRQRGLQPTPEHGASLVIEALQRGGASAIYHVLDEGDVERIMRHPLTMIGSDGRLTRPREGHPHPRWYGTFPRVLGPFVRDRRVLSLEQAVHKMTGLSAARLGLQDRGRLVEGAYADLVVFDPATVRDRATFEDPHQYPEGIEYVFVNGVAVVDGGRFTDARPGRGLRHGS